MAITDAKKFWGWGVLLLWGGLILGLNVLRMTPYGIDETAARSLLLDWSIMDRVANPIAFYGIPDFRLLLLAPATVYWTGSIVAAKVVMMLLSFTAVTLLYRWSKTRLDAETALFASGMLLLSPLWLLQIEALATGPLLVLLFAVGAWLDERYLASGRVLGGWYFMHMIVVAAAVSLHPAGLAYPLAVILKWRRDSNDTRRQKDVYIGCALAALFILLMWAGWTQLSWFSNPITVLGQAAVAGFTLEPRGSWWLGTALLFLFLLIAVFNWKKVTESLLGISLFLSALFGAIAADLSWALLLVIFILYFGLPLLIRLNEQSSRQGLFGKRGLMMVLLFVLGNVFLLADKAHRQEVLTEQLNANDALIRLLSFEVESLEKDIHIASEWPGRTMLVLKRPILPLPPASLSDEKMAEAVQGLDILVFDPDTSNHLLLVKTIANMTGETQTLVREKGGVVVGVYHSAQ